MCTNITKEIEYSQKYTISLKMEHVQLEKKEIFSHILKYVSHVSPNAIAMKNKI